jgi:hypothetical protein
LEVNRARDLFFFFFFCSDDLHWMLVEPCLNIY